MILDSTVDIYGISGLYYTRDLPKGWSVIPLKYLLSSSLKYGANESAEFDNINWPRFIRITDIDECGNLKDETFRSINPEKAGDYLLKQGDLLFARSGATVGKTFLYQKTTPACYAGYLIKAKCNDKLFPKFLLWFTQSGLYENWKNGIYIQSTIQNISADKYNYLPIILPPLESQHRISFYLDSKTSEIDSKIAVLTKKKEAYLKLKTAIINRAVTQGLNPNVKLKPSGIDWLGDVPEHWKIKRVKSVCKTIKGKVTDYFDVQIKGSYLLMNLDILRDKPNTFKYYAVTDSKEQICKEGDLVIIWDGAGVGEILKTHDGILASTTAKIKVNDLLIDKDYFWNWRYKIENLLKSMPIGMGIPHLSPTLFNGYMITIPPLQEQKEIADYLDKKCSAIDNVTIIIGKQIEAYKHLRRSLINEVITGQRTIQ